MMCRFTTRCAAVALLVVTACVLVTSAAAAAPGLVVTAAWVAEHRADADLVILHVGSRDGYQRGHIPGARHLDFPQLSDPGATLRLQMPSPERLREIFETLGISDTSRVVIYVPDESLTAATRTFVALDSIGLGDRASILDGGQRAWAAAGQGLSTETPPPARGRITAALDPGVIVDGAYVRAHLDDRAVRIVDARAHEFYTGARATSMPRQGHIAGAVSVPFDGVVDSTTLMLKDEASLRRMLASAGIAPDAGAGQQIVTYCHIGLQASQVYFVARRLGYRVHLYDGSFEDWSAHPEWPIETGSN